MNKRTLLLVILLIPLFAFAQENKYRKLVEEYDVWQYVKNLDRQNPETFWDAIWRKNKGLNTLQEAVKNEKSDLRLAQNQIAEAKVINDIYFRKVKIDTNLQYVADTIISLMKLRKIFPNTDIVVINSDEENAFTAPEGRIYLTNALLNKVGLNYDELLGICAHEFSHFLFQHALSEVYAVERKRRKNKIIADISAAISIGANAYAQANGAADETSWDNVKNTIASTYSQMDNDAKGRFKYKYSRNQELEADIVAFRYLQWLGIGGEYYIRALKLISTEGDEYNTKNSDHPKLSFRIGLLEYLSKINNY